MNIKEIAIRVGAVLVIALSQFTIAQTGSTWETNEEKAYRESKERRIKSEQEKKESIKRAAMASASIVTDPRDGQKYRTIKIGKIEWMAENLNYVIGGSGCYDDDVSYCKKYGRLYKLTAAVSACQGMGNGWRLPTTEEWRNLKRDAGGGLDGEGTTLKSKSGWNRCDYNDYGHRVCIDNGNGIDAYGFSALPGGRLYGENGNFLNAGHKGYWWSAAGRSTSASSHSMTYSGSFMDENSRDMRSGYSVRCVRAAELSTSASTTPAEPAKAATIPTPAANKAVSATPPTAIGQTNPVNSVKIGNLTWTKQNINIETPGSWCYENKSANCVKYGRLYTWEDAKNACQSMGGAWQLPTNEDWDNLVKAVGGVRTVGKNKDGEYIYYTNAGKTLKSKSGWENNGNGTDNYGFSALPGGYHYAGGFLDAGRLSPWWSATEYDAGNAYSRSIHHNSDNVAESGYGKGGGFSARCVAHDSVATTSTIGQTNPAGSVKIGNLTWTKQNLNIETPNSWCYENKSANCTKYGRLYTWEAAKNACQSMGGKWRLPTSEDWDNLMRAVGGVREVYKSEGYEYIHYTKAGTMLKSKHGWSGHYNDNDGNGTDNYGFSALPGGNRNASGVYGNVYGISYNGSWWSATESNAGNAYYRNISYLYGNVSEYNGDKRDGFSARCVAQDSVAATSTIGQTNPAGSVKIGNLTWTKQNLNIETPNSWCYENDKSNCAKYGRLYTWEAAKNACQSMVGNWRLPTHGDWQILVNHAGGFHTAGEKLKAKSGWDRCDGKGERCVDNGNGTDDYGFSALPGGVRAYTNGVGFVGKHGHWWTATEIRSGEAYHWSMYYSSGVAGTGAIRTVGGGFSVRCVQD